MEAKTSLEATEDRVVLPIEPASRQLPNQTVSSPCELPPPTNLI